MKCKLCEADFTPRPDRAQIYCSSKCRKRANVLVYASSAKGKRGQIRRKVAYQGKLRTLASEIKRRVGCKFCLERHPACLDFHHRDPKEKLFSVANGINKSGIGKEKLLIEIAKCDVICSNCHRKHHWENSVSPTVREKEYNQPRVLEAQ